MTTRKVTDYFPEAKRGKKGGSKGKKQDEPVEVPAPTTSNKETEELGLLKQFDLQWEFGPCTGVTRLERWERAAGHGLNPPEEVKDLLLAHAQDDKYTQCLWSGYTL